MKRWFSLALVALFLVPVLAVGVRAEEVYVFEPFELPFALSGSFEFSVDTFGLYMSGLLPPGQYLFSAYDGDQLIFSSSDPVVLRFDVNTDFGLASNFSLTAFDFTFDLTCILYDEPGEEATIIVSEGTSFPCTSVVLTRVGDLPSQGGFDSLLGDVSSFTGSCISFITKVADTITGSPLLLLTVGILFIGGCIGITGRLFSRR